MTTQIVPSLGAGILFTQGGVGSAPGYSAIDVRRGDSMALSAGIVGQGAYLVSQRGAGANMSVDIAANVGLGVNVPGTTIGAQGFYQVPPHSAVINEAISPADLTNPRVDQIIVQCFDNTIDSSSNNKAQTTVLAGTPTAGATIGIGGNRNGAAALPANSIRLADVLVTAGVGSITSANCFDRRPKTRGMANINISEVRTNTAYGVMPTPDQVTEIVLATNALIVVAYQATWQESVSGAGSAALFLNGVQLEEAGQNATVVAAVGSMGGTANESVPLSTSPVGLTSTTGGTGYPGDVTTGQIVGVGVFGGPCYIFAAAGTYAVSVRFKSSSGSVTALNRQLWCWTMNPAQAVLG